MLWLRALDESYAIYGLIIAVVQLFLDFVSTICMLNELNVMDSLFYSAFLKILPYRWKFEVIFKIYKIVSTPSKWLD